MSSLSIISFPQAEINYRRPDVTFCLPLPVGSFPVPYPDVWAVDAY